MNLSDPSWFAQLRISGVPAPLEFEGSVSHITLQVMKILSSANPRELADGKQITLQFGSKPFASVASASRAIQKQAIEIESQIEFNDDESRPIEGETYESYYDRQITRGLSPTMAEFAANDWFDIPQNPRLTAWLNDPKAQRFRELNSSHKAFESAMPSEYESLKEYVKSEYAEFTDALVFRTA